MIDEDRRVPTIDKHRARVSQLIGDRPLSARSVLASALLGADQPHLTVGELVAMASLFGISEGAARTCLWRMVSTGELTSDDGSYALAGRLSERRQRVDEASRIDVAAARPPLRNGIRLRAHCVSVLFQRARPQLICREREHLMSRDCRSR